MGVAYCGVVRGIAVSPLVLGLLAAVAALLVLPRSGRPAAGRALPAAPTHRASPATRPLRMAVVALLAGAGVAVLVGGGVGLVLGAGLGLAVGIGVPRLESRADREHRERCVAQAPQAIDLVAACLASGAAVEASLAAAASAVGAPVRDELVSVVAALRLGASPVGAWSGVDPTLHGLARAVVRSSETGAPLADLLPRVAAEARAGQRAAAEARVRTAAVRLTAPLGAAFLPAFVLLGVVPVVASWLGVLL